MVIQTRRSFLRRLRSIGLLPLLAGGGVYGVGSTLERHRLVVDRHDVRIGLGEHGPRKLRIVALSDFHFDPLYETDYLERFIRAANDLDADLVVLTGDFITHEDHRIDELSKALGSLKSRDGIFACLGNHDYYLNSSTIVSSLRRNGIETLENQRAHIQTGGGELILAGLQSAWRGAPNWPLASRGLRMDQRCLVLMHEPDYAGWLGSDPRIALQVSGHTHGGQVCIPGVGALRLPRWGLKYVAGFYDVGQMKLYVSRGLGTVHVNVRLFCPPEVTCFDLTNSDVTA